MVAESVASLGEEFSRIMADDVDLHVRLDAARQALAQASVAPRFRLDCVDRMLESIEIAPTGWANPPVYRDPDGNFSMRLLHWPPKFRNNPHVHRSWTVTGVMTNRYDVTTYRADGDRLVEDERFEGAVGDVGVVVPPCIHSAHNPGDVSTTTLHVFSLPGVDMGRGVDEALEDGATMWYPDAERGRIMAGGRRRALLAACGIASEVPGERAVGLLRRTFRIGDRRVRSAVVKAMAPMAPDEAGRRLVELAADFDPPDRDRLSRLGAELQASACST